MADEQRTVGPWLLGERLGRGGNATVWRATRPGDDREVALKVIDATKPQREPYRRFIQEIEFLLYIGFHDELSVDSWSLSFSTGLKWCGYVFTLGVLDCELPTFSSVDGPKEFLIRGAVRAPSVEGTWGRFTVTVDPHNDLAEYDEWNNVAFVDLPLWPHRQVYEISPGDLNVTYYRFPPQ